MNLCSPKGFTLIEMLVVIVITSTALSLVAPNFFHVYEEIKVSAEEEKLFDIIETVKMKAFLRKMPCTIIFENNLLQVKDEPVRIEFDFIQFSSCSLIFNRNGFPNISTLTYVVMGENKIIEL